MVYPPFPFLLPFLISFKGRGIVSTSWSSQLTSLRINAPVSACLVDAKISNTAEVVLVIPGLVVDLHDVIFSNSQTNGWKTDLTV